MNFYSKYFQDELDHLKPHCLISSIRQSFHHQSDNNNNNKILQKIKFYKKKIFNLRHNVLHHGKIHLKKFSTDHASLYFHSESFLDY